jgi:uncharacterized iron-regulated protein
MDGTYKDARSLNKGEIMHYETGRLFTPDELLDYVSRYPIVYVGEIHDSAEDHRIQLDIIKGLYERFPGKIAIGLEMLQNSSQEAADAFIKGEMTDKEFLRVWGNNWHGLFQYYKEIIFYAKDKGIQLIALNANDEIKKEIRGKDIKDIDENFKKKLPEMDLADPYYDAFIASIFGGHGHGGPDVVEKFKQMQTLWDETMADTAANYLKKNIGQDKHLVILSGGAHVHFGFGIPRRLFRRVPLPYVIIESFPVEVSSEKKDNKMEVKEVKIPLKPVDFYLAIKYEGVEDKTVRLGVSIQPADGSGVKVFGVAPGSPAEKGGMKQNDVIVSMDNFEIKEMYDVTYQVSQHSAGDSGTIEVLRDGKKIKLTVVYDVMKEQ